MPTHKLSQGKRLIAALGRLGRLLGYHVETEFPVSSSHQAGEAPAVDVAWFSEKGQRFPLMIFEVESKASNSMANNVLKVFGQHTDKFERPLFFFQVVADGGSSSSRVDTLRAQYGTHNYRLYLMSNDDGTRLVRDILAQHRRIRDRADHAGLFRLMKTPDWQPFANANAALAAAHELGLSPNARLPDLVQLLIEGHDVTAELMAEVNALNAKEWSSAPELGSYVGSIWAPFLLCSWACTASCDRETWLGRLLSWQRSGDGLRPFSREIQVGQEYREAMLGLASAVLTIGAVAFGGDRRYMQEFLPVMTGILERLEPGWWGFHVALWLLHLAARYDAKVEYAVAQAFISEAGGVEESMLMEPPSSMSSDFESEHILEAGPLVEVPSMVEFKTLALARYAAGCLSPGILALRSAQEDAYFFGWMKDVLHCLWSSPQ